MIGSSPSIIFLEREAWGQGYSGYVVEINSLEGGHKILFPKVCVYVCTHVYVCVCLCMWGVRENHKKVS